MKKTFAILCFFAIIGASQVIKAQSGDVLPILVGLKYDFSADIEPSEKKLKSKIKTSTQEEVIEYSFYLVNYLRTQINRNPEKTEKYYKSCVNIINEQIAPKAAAGDLNSILFYNSFQDFTKTLSSSYNPKYIDIVNAKAKNPLEKYYIFQENIYYNNRTNTGSYEYLFGYGDEHCYNRDINKHEFELQEYFKSFKKERLIEIREIINAKYNEIIKLKVTNTISSTPFFPEGLKSSDISDIKENDFILKFFIFPDRDRTYAASKVYVQSLTGNTISVSADDYLFILRTTIDMLLMNEFPKSFAQLLYSYVNDEFKPFELTKDYTAKENQFFENDKTYGPIIYKLLSGIVVNDWKDQSLKIKKYYFNKAIEIGDNSAYYNLACIYYYYAIASSNEKYKDSCRYYIEKGIENNIADAFTFKGVLLFNGDGYVQNKDKGVELMQKGLSLGGSFAKKIMVELPEYMTSQASESYLKNEKIKIRQPWDFKVKCSNCGEYCYPKEFTFGKTYNSDENMPQVKSTELYLDNFGNPVISASWNDFRKTFTIAKLGYNKTWKHVMCSPLCQQEYENKNNENWESMKNKRIAFDNELIKCASCGKEMKRKDMKSISSCPCWDNNGNTNNVSFTQSYDIYGDSEPKVCSDGCVIKYCKVKCTEHGYNCKY